MDEDIRQLMSPQENILQVFFHLLWQKTGPNRTAHTLRNIRIPPTVSLNHSRPLSWYFTAKDGTIKMKGRKKMSSLNVVTELAEKRVSKTGCPIAATLFTADPKAEDGVVCSQVGYKGFSQRLTEDAPSGTLQGFIEPKGTASVVQNHMIVINWTPNVMYVEKRTNRLNLLDTTGVTKYSLNERATLDEASLNVSTAPLVSTRITSELERICKDIAQHIHEIHGTKVTSMVLHMKLDQMDSPWLLYCSTLRVMLPNSKEELSLTLLPSRAPQMPRSRASSLTTTPSRGDTREKTCALCMRQNGGMTALPQKHILFPLSIVSFFNSNPPGTVFCDAALQTPGEVPAHVSLLRPDLSFEEYRRLLDEGGVKGWEDQMVTICNQCATGMQSITASINIDRDGFIRVPSERSSNALRPRAANESVKPTAIPAKKHYMTPLNSRPSTRAKSAEPISSSALLSEDDDGTPGPSKRGRPAKLPLIPRPHTRAAPRVVQ